MHGGRPQEVVLLPQNTCTTSNEKESRAEQHGRSYPDFGSDQVLPIPEFSTSATSHTG